MKFTLLTGTARKNRKSIYVAEKTAKVLEDEGHEVFFFDPQEREVPPLGSRTFVDEGESPEDIQELSQEVQESDGVIIVTPEYNHSIPGVLKTALDYLYPEYDEKPFSFITVSGGGFGGVRVLNHIHDIVLELGGFVGPDMQVSRVGEVFSENGELLDKNYNKRFSDFVKDTVDFVERMR